MSDAKKQGASYEALFIAEALKRGLDVYEPRGDYLSHDMLVSGKTKRDFRVQIKGTTFKVRGKQHYKVLGAKGKSVKVMLSPEDCDVFAVYVAPAKVWYLIPVEKLTGVSVYLSPNNEYSQAQFELWKDAWNVFV